MSKINNVIILALPFIPFIAFSMQPMLENESATYSKDGIVINVDVLRKTPKETIEKQPLTPLKNQDSDISDDYDNYIFNDEPLHMETSSSPTTSYKSNEELSLLEPTVIKHDFFIYTDESYFDAINRWLKNEGINNIAWALDDNSTIALKKNPSGIVSFSGSIRTALPLLSKQIGVPFYFSETSNLAAIHQWHNRDVQIVMVRGETVQEAIKQLTLDYGWSWQEGNSKNKSWLAKNDYPFSASYPLVTPKDDIARALQLVLQGYPITAQLLNGTNSIFIVDTQ